MIFEFAKVINHKANTIGLITRCVCTFHKFVIAFANGFQSATVTRGGIKNDRTLIKMWLFFRVLSRRGRVISNASCSNKAESSRH